MDLPSKHASQIDFAGEQDERGAPRDLIVGVIHVGAIHVGAVNLGGRWSH